VHGVTGGKVILNGRTEMVSLSQRISTSYSCADDCPAAYYGGINPPSAVEAVGDTFTMTAWEMAQSTAGYTMGPYSASGTWSSLNTSIATINGLGNGTAEAPGQTAIGFLSGPQTIFVWDGLNCVDVGSSQWTEDAGMTVIKITFQKANGASLPSPLRVGITANNHDRKQQLRAMVEPAAEAANITLSVSAKLQISDVSNSSGTINFKVVGITKSASQGDATITATHNAGTTSTHSVSVVVPSKVGTPHETFSGNVTGVNLVGSPTSIPPIDSPPGRVELLTMFIRTLTILVLDQFDSPVGDLYAGANITEFGGTPINVTLSSSSTYPDVVGHGISRDYPLNNPYLPNSPEALSWSTDSPVTMFVGNDITQNISVEVDGFALNPAIVNRRWVATPPNGLVIIWP
jgi:Bacterial Ig-like domain (group 2)